MLYLYSFAIFAKRREAGPVLERAEIINGNSLSLAASVTFETRLNTGCTLAADDERAKKDVWDFALATYPKEYGWEAHQVSVWLVSDDLVRRSAQAAPQ